jgi:hypothetical protein
MYLPASNAGNRLSACGLAQAGQPKPLSTSAFGTTVKYDFPAPSHQKSALLPIKSKIRMSPFLPKIPGTKNEPIRAY